MIKIPIDYWVLIRVLARMDILIMVVKFVKNAIIFGYILIIFKTNSYECIQNENNCISCNDAITFRYLFENNCLCNSKYFDN